MKKTSLLENFFRLANTIPLPIILGFIIVKNFKSNNNSAILILQDIDLSSLFELLLLLPIFYMFTLIAIYNICIICHLDEDISNTISNYIAGIITFTLLAWGLLTIFTIEQFSLLATFIGLPFVTIIPKFINTIRGIKKVNVQIRKDESLNNDSND
ncbi:hypothetical protein [Streptococcus uberis]|uniref:hypothetical protein n=1 Tax=Streptococcus uberis TaxID=1349 RepID=UPI00193ADA47|nr:hypothetical protein [Streptococcus uberis]